MQGDGIRRKARSFGAHRRNPTPLEAERWRATRLRWCPGCNRLRMRLYVVSDDACRWCLEDPDPPTEAEVEDHRQFARGFYRRFLKRQQEP